MLPLWTQNLGMGTPGTVVVGPQKAVVVMISEAVVDVLNSTTLSLPYEAGRAYEITRQLRFEGIKISVLPAVLVVSGQDLHPRKYLDWQVAVWLQKVTDLDVESIDPIMLLMEEIVLLFVFNRLEGTPARCIAVETTPPIDNDQLKAKGMFLSGIYFTFRWSKL